MSAIVVLLLLPQLKDAGKVGEYQPGQQLEIAEMFKEGDSIDIAGTTVGKGFQGEQQSSRPISSQEHNSSSSSNTPLVNSSSRNMSLLQVAQMVHSAVVL